MIKTYGLTHISLAVKDLDRSLRFYQSLFGVKEYYWDENSIQGLGPHDVIWFEHKPKSAGKRAGIDHFGFRLTTAKDIDKAVREAERAGGKILRRGEFALGFPYVYIEDPDGYEIEIWYE